MLPGRSEQRRKKTCRRLTARPLLEEMGVIMWCWAMRPAHDGLRLMGLGLTALCSCGPEREPPADCEGDGPTRLVELSNRPTHHSLFPGIRDDRGWLFFDPDDGIRGRGLAVECGESPRVFARDIPSVFRFGDGGPWIGVAQPPDEAADIFILDPWGGTPPVPVPRRVFGLVDGRLLIGEGSIWTPDISLWRAEAEYPYELEPVSLEWSANPEQRASWAWSGQDLSVHPLEILFVDVREGDVRMTVGVDSRTGETRFVEDKEFHRAKMGGRFVVLREVEDDERRYVVIDTSNPDQRIELPSSGWSWSCCLETFDSVSMSRASGNDVVETYLVLLPEMRELRLEGDWSLAHVAGRTGDARQILRSPEGFFLLQPNSSTPELLYPTVHGWGRLIGDTLQVRDWGWDLDPSFESGYALVEVPLDGSGTTVVLEPPVYGAMRLTRDRWLLQRDIVDGVGDLSIFDNNTGREETALEGVDAGFAAWNSNGRFDLPWGTQPSAPSTEIVFSRSTPDRTTVWRWVP
jgi:hypothetical protein